MQYAAYIRCKNKAMDFFLYLNYIRLNMMTQRPIVGCEISVFPPLSTAAGSQTEGDQAGMSKVREPREAEISQNSPEESLCWNQLHLLELQNCQSGQLT